MNWYIEIVQTSAGYASKDRNFKLRKVFIHPSSIAVMTSDDDLETYFEENEPIPDLKTKSFTKLYLCNGLKLSLVGDCEDIGKKMFGV